MATWADQMWEAAFQIARAINNDPAIVEARKKAAEAESRRRRAEEAEARRVREAEEAERAHRRSIDTYVLSGSGDECTRAGLAGDCGTEGCSLWAEDRCPHGERPPLPEGMTDA